MVSVYLKPISAWCFLPRGVFSLRARMHGSRNQEMEVGLAPMRVMALNSLKAFLLPLFETLSSVSLEVLLLPREECFFQGIPPCFYLNWNLETVLWSFRALHATEPTHRTGSLQTRNPHHPALCSRRSPAPCGLQLVLWLLGVPWLEGTSRRLGRWEESGVMIFISPAVACRVASGRLFGQGYTSVGRLFPVL